MSVPMVCCQTCRFYETCTDKMDNTFCMKWSREKKDHGDEKDPNELWSKGEPGPIDQ